MNHRLQRAVEMLLTDLCTSVEYTSFAQRWGRSEPSARRPQGVRVACDATCPFESLEIRPWDDDVTGVVDLKLRGDGKRLTWDDLRDCFGPFEKLPALDAAADKFGAVWAIPGAVASAFVIVSVTDRVVHSLTIRRDPC